MDELELLKKDWKKQQGNYPQVSYDQLYKMIWKKSSSIVKWIFIISILELFVGTILNVVTSNKDSWEMLEKYNLKTFMEVYYVIGYLVTFYFIYRFYINYKRINATDTASKLMKNILRTRKTVKYYIGWVLISSGLTVAGVTAYMIILHISSQNSEITKYSFDTWQWAKFIGIFILGLSIFLGLIWLLYSLLYGILLRRLKTNYEELKKLEV